MPKKSARLDAITGQTAALLDLLPQEALRPLGNAQSFHPETRRLYFTLTSPTPTGLSEAVIVRSDGVLLPYTLEAIHHEGFYPLQSTMDPKTYALLPPSVLARWSRQSLKAFLSARTRPPTPAEVYEAITEYLKRFVYHDDPRALSLLVLFTMASYLHSLFEALPLLLITGERATGKTRLVELLSELGFNGQLRGSLTPAALARHVQRDQPLLCLDEAEDLGHSRRHQEIFRLLRAMYRRSGSREVCGAGGTSAVFNLFCPVILINIMGVDDALRDRIIEIQSTPRAGSVDRFRLHEQRDTLQGLRDKLYHFACAYVGEVYEDYHTCPQVAVISDRTEELWLPIFTLATVVDTTADAPGLFDEMVRFCRELHQKKAEQEQYATRDTKIIAGVYCFLSERGFLGSPSADINAAELTTCISVTESMPDLPIAEVSRVLDRAKIISKRFRRRVPGHATSPNPLIHYCIDQYLRQLRKAEGRLRNMNTA